MSREEFTPTPKIGAPCSAFVSPFRDKTEPLNGCMDNVIASRLGDIARCAGHAERTDVGDSIDRGLILLRMLNDAGLNITIDTERK